MSRLPVPALAVLLFFCSALGAQAQERQLAHMVYFTLTDDTPENRRRLIAACNKHLKGHEGVVYFSAGAAADDLRREVNDRQFDVALHLVFADKKAHDKYQTHARHLRFIKENKQLWSMVRVFDAYVAKTNSPPTLSDLLNAKISVACRQMSMHLAVKKIQNGFMETHKPPLPLQITIEGNDLKLEGITRNQRIRDFSQRDQSLSDVLTHLVCQANPLGKVASPADPKQILVWAVAPDGKSILITTRTAARRKSYALPKVFRAK